MFTMPILPKVVATTLKLSLEENEANLKSRGLIVEMDEHQLQCSDPDEENNRTDTVEADLLSDGTCETLDNSNSLDSGAVSGGQLAINFALQQNGIAGSTSEEEKKIKRALRFGSVVANPDANGESTTYPIRTQMATQLQEWEPMDTSEPISKLGEGYGNGESGSSQRNLPDEEKKQERALRFGTTSLSDNAAFSGQTSKVGMAEVVGNLAVSSGAGIKKSATSPEAKASKQKMECLMEAIFKDLEAYYENHRNELLESNGQVSTPLHALKECATFYKETIHQEITCLPIADAHKPMIRTELIVGRFKGTGEAYDKRASTQMAALDILLKMKVRESGLRVVPFGLIPGWRISPRVCDDLLKFCDLNGLQVPRFVISSNVEEKDKPVFGIECFLGTKLMSRVDTDVHHYGRKQVAAKTLEQLTGEKYPREYLAFGVSCMDYKEMVEIGFKPVMSDRKRTWMLEQFEQYGEAVFRYGADRDELHALQLDLTNCSRIKAGGSNVLKRRLAITESTSSAK